MSDPLKQSSSRRVFLEGGRIVKFYPKVYGYLFHDLFRILFQAFNGIYKMDFVSRKRRIMNELRAREVLGSMGIETTEIVSYSFNSYFLEETFEKDMQNLAEIEKEDPSLASKYAREIGKMTRRVNNNRIFFIDNKSGNWLSCVMPECNGSSPSNCLADEPEKYIKRIDLEYFRPVDLPNKRLCDFYAECDVMSFLSSVKSRVVKEAFIEGYGKRPDYSPLAGFLSRLYISSTALLF